jgi:hypothetical protein
MMVGRFKTEETMTELEKLIADSIVARDAARVAEISAREAEEGRYQALFQSLLARSIEAVKPYIPAPLQPYIQYPYSLGSKDALDAQTWRPTMLHVQDAPGLEEIVIAIYWREDWTPEIYEITSGDRFDGDQWADAIAAAYDRYQNRRAEYSKAARGLDY